jgi:hypothetical protein
MDVRGVKTPGSVGAQSNRFGGSTKSMRRQRLYHHPLRRDAISVTTHAWETE